MFRVIFLGILITLSSLQANAEPIGKEVENATILGELSGNYPRFNNLSFLRDKSAGDDYNVALLLAAIDTGQYKKAVKMYHFNMSMLMEFSEALRPYPKQKAVVSQVSALHYAYSEGAPDAPTYAALLNDPCFADQGFLVDLPLCQKAAVAAYLYNKYERYADWHTIKYPNDSFDDRDVFITDKYQAP